MDSDDPFSNNDSDRTVIRPTPGRRSDTPSAPSAGQVAPPPGQPPQAPMPAGPRSYAPPGGVDISGSGLNPLVDAATGLLVLAGQLRNTPTHPDVAGLREHVARQIQMFEQKARGLGVEPETALAARYTLCTFLDEIVLTTPWGSESSWSSQSLLVTFHKESWGGEKFFQILDRMMQDPLRNIELLELMNICLLLGFEGKFSVMEQGAGKLVEIQDRLFQAIRMYRGDIERDLSPNWQGVQSRSNMLIRYVPLWVVGALAGVLLLVTYGGFRFILESSSSSVYDLLDEVGRPVAGTVYQGAGNKSE
jgi:type VI secretion system protein ImpK